MTAEVLREAASLMRERAEAATPGPWKQRHSPTYGPQAEFAGPDGRVSLSVFTAPYRGAETAAHIASWDPAVTIAVAEWLDEEADEQEALGSSDAPNVTPAGACAYAVARAYLGVSR